jgi:hypothetical protein
MPVRLVGVVVLGAVVGAAVAVAPAYADPVVSPDGALAAVARVAPLAQVATGSDGALCRSGWPTGHRVPPNQ